jgi:hypothetical protein
MALVILVLHLSDADLLGKTTPEVEAIPLANLGNQTKQQCVMCFLLRCGHEAKFSFIHEGSPVKVEFLQFPRLRGNFNVTGRPLPLFEMTP